MDNQMIVDFINNVEPNFSYGTSDGMARAMVESAENMALINDYIVESTYEVYTEADGDRNIFGKIKDKLSVYFTLLMNVIKKFIAKIKGFFMTVKRKLTQAMAKAVKTIGEFLKNRVKNNPEHLKEQQDMQGYYWHEPKLSAFKGFIDNNKDLIDANQEFTVEEAKAKIAELDSKFEQIAKVGDTTQSALLITTTYSFAPADAAKFLSSEFEQKISKPVDETYSKIMESTNAIIVELKKTEQKVTKDLKAASGEGIGAVKNKFKGLNMLIAHMNMYKFKIAQKVASAAFTYFKKLFSIVRKVVRGFSFSENKEEKIDIDESFGIISQIQ